MGFPGRPSALRSWMFVRGTHLVRIATNPSRRWPANITPEARNATAQLSLRPLAVSWRLALSLFGLRTPNNFGAGVSPSSVVASRGDDHMLGVAAALHVTLEAISDRICVVAIDVLILWTLCDEGGRW